MKIVGGKLASGSRKHLHSKEANENERTNQDRIVTYKALRESLPYSKLYFGHGITDKILNLVGYDVPPDVEMMLMQALGDYNLDRERQLILRGATRFTNPWTSRYRQKKVDSILQQRANVKIMVQQQRISVQVNTKPDPNFRNNDDPTKSALVFERLNQGLPTELREKVESSVITIDPPSQNYCKIVQILPHHPKGYSSKLQYPATRLMTTVRSTSHESREAIVANLKDYVYINTSSSPNNNSRKLIFSQSVGDILFINILKNCAAALTAPGFQDGLEGSFSSKITTIAIHDRNFFLWGLGATDEETEFVKIGNILSKFTSLTKLWVVIAKSIEKRRLSPKAAMKDLEYKADSFIMQWSTHKMTVATLRGHFDTYASTNRSWVMPELLFTDATNPERLRG